MGRRGVVEDQVARAVGVELAAHAGGGLVVLGHEHARPLQLGAELRATRQEAASRNRVARAFVKPLRRRLGGRETGTGVGRTRRALQRGDVESAGARVGQQAVGLAVKRITGLDHRRVQQLRLGGIEHDFSGRDEAGVAVAAREPAVVQRVLDVEQKRRRADHDAVAEAERPGNARQKRPPRARRLLTGARQLTCCTSLSARAPRTPVWRRRCPWLSPRSPSRFPPYRRCGASAAPRPAPAR